MSGQQETGIKAARFSRLGSNGLPVITTAGTAVTPSGAWAACDPISLDISFEYDTGTDTVQKDGSGRLCFARRRPNNLKNGTVKFELCGGDPRQMELILSGPGVVIGGGTVTGFGLQNASCNAPARNGVFIEWWTENYACNALNAATPVTRHFLPLAICDYDGGTWDEGRHAFAFTGVANAGVVDSSATGYEVGGGPFNDIVNFPSDQAFLYGYQTVAAEATVVDNMVCTVGYTDLPAQGT